MADPGPRRASHRTWPERLAITATILAAVLSFLAAGTLVAAYVVVGPRPVVQITNPADALPAPTTTRPGPTTTRAPGVTTPAPVTTTNETFPPADPQAQNFLLTGAD